MFYWLTTTWIRYRLLIGIAYLLLLIALSIRLPTLHVHHHLEDYYPERDTAYAQLLEFYRRFGRDDRLLLFGIQTPPDSIWAPTLWRQIYFLVESLRALPVFAQVYSLTHIRIPTKHSLTPQPLVNDHFQPDTQLILSNPGTRWLIAPTRQTVAVVGVLRTDLNQLSLQGIRAIERILRNTGLHHQVCIVGKYWTETRFLIMAVRELLLYSALSILFISILIWLLFWSWQYVLIVVTLLVISLWTVAVWLAWTSPQVPIVVTILPAILFICALSDFVHLSLHYIEGRRAGFSASRALFLAIRHAFRPTLFTSLTTAIGFLGLLLSALPVLRWLGMHAAIGVMLVYVSTLLVGIPALTFLPVHTLKTGPLWHLSQKAMNGLHKIFQHAWKTATFFLGTLFFITGLGITHLRVDTWMFADVAPGNPLYEDFLCLKNNFRLVRAQDWCFQARQPLHHNLHPARAAEAILHTIWKDAVVIGPASVLKDIPPGVRPAARPILWHHPLFRLVDSSGYWFRIRLQIPDSGAHHLFAKIEQARTALDTISGMQTSFPTGFMYVFDRAILHVTENLMKSILIIVSAISLLTWLFTRNLRVALLFALANIIPLFVLGGSMGWLGITLRATTATLFTLAYGLAVDSTAHIVFGYLWVRHLTPSAQTQLQLFLYRICRFVFFNGLFLLAVFLILLTSSFLLTRYVGLFLLLSLLSAHLIDLIIVGGWLIRTRPIQNQ